MYTFRFTFHPVKPLPKTSSTERVEGVDDRTPRVIFMPELVDLQPLVGGAYGLLHRATWQGQSVVLKQPKYTSESQLKELTSILALPAHSNVIRIIGIVHQPDHVALVLPFCPGGSLADVMADEERWAVLSTPSSVQQLMIDVCRGIHHLHLHRHLHRDIAPRNILLGLENTAIVTDLGLSVKFDEATSVFRDSPSDKLFPLPWTAPESISDLVFSPSSDVYSLGVLLWQLVTSVPFPQFVNVSDLKDLLKHAQERRLALDMMFWPTTGAFASELWRELVLACTDNDITERPTLPDVISRLSALPVAAIGSIIVPPPDPTVTVACASAVVANFNNSRSSSAITTLMASYFRAD